MRFAVRLELSAHKSYTGWIWRECASQTGCICHLDSSTVTCFPIFLSREIRSCSYVAWWQLSWLGSGGKQNASIILYVFFFFFLWGFSEGKLCRSKLATSVEVELQTWITLPLFSLTFLGLCLPGCRSERNGNATQGEVATSHVMKA